jgi:phage-related protein
MMREIIFFETDFSNKPVEKFLAGLDAPVRAKVVRTLELLRTQRIVPGKFWKKLSGSNLWEARVEYAGNIYRVLATFGKGNRVILLHAFQKKSQKTRLPGYGNCSAKAKAAFSTGRLPVKDDLDTFHEQNMAVDPEYAIARQLLDLGEAVACLREKAGLTRSELGKQLRVKARDIAVIEEETPRAPAGLREAAPVFWCKD